LARPLKWYSNIATIKADAEKSPIETWDRGAIQALFNVSRATAQQIMKAIGGIENVHRVYIVSRGSLLDYLERMKQAEDPHIEHNRKIEGHEPIPRAEKVTVPIPDRMKAVMVRDLPDGIVLESGHLAFYGEGYQQVLELVGAFLMACKNDPDTVITLLNQPSKAPERVDDELRSLFADLRACEQLHAVSRRVVCMDKENSTDAVGVGEDEIRSAAVLASHETPLQ